LMPPYLNLILLSLMGTASAAWEAGCAVPDFDWAAIWTFCASFICNLIKFCFIEFWFIFSASEQGSGWLVPETRDVDPYTLSIFLLILIIFPAIDFD
jgi:hypothetical protein